MTMAVGLKLLVTFVLTLITGGIVYGAADTANTERADTVQDIAGWACMISMGGIVLILLLITWST